MEGKWRDEKTSWYPVFLHYIGRSSSAPWGDTSAGWSWCCPILYGYLCDILGIKISSDGNNTIGGAIDMKKNENKKGFFGKVKDVVDDFFDEE